MAKSGEEPVLRFDNLEDNREVPVRFDGIEIVNKLGGIEERHEAVPGEERRQLKRVFCSCKGKYAGRQGAVAESDRCGGPSVV